MARETENEIALCGCPAEPLAPFVPLVPFVPAAPLLPLVPFAPSLPAFPTVLNEIFFSLFLHFVFAETMRIVPPYFFWQA